MGCGLAGCGVLEISNTPLLLKAQSWKWILEAEMEERRMEGIWREKVDAALNLGVLVLILAKIANGETRQARIMYFCIVFIIS